MHGERKNIRLKGWDYSAEGCYFLTICCRNRKPFLGSIIDHKMRLSDIGSIVSQFWREIPNHFPHVGLDEFVVMPNHLHGIIILDYDLLRSRHAVTLLSKKGDEFGTCNSIFQNPNQKNSVSVIINQFKSSVKRWCNKNGSDNFEWQTRFYDQIIQDYDSIQNIRDYIKDNPANWSQDELYI